MMLYLASLSPRRTRLLKEAGIPHRVVRVSYKESPLRGLGPAALVRKHALGKAKAALALIKNGRVLAADTIVYFQNKIIGKPKNMRQAKKILSLLQGRWHCVYTGVVLFEMRAGKARRLCVFHETTGVKLRSLDLAAIRRYFRRVDPLDKAGAYAIQAKSGSIVEKVQGSFSNAVGLPMERLCARMKKL